MMILILHLVSISSLSDFVFSLCGRFFLSCRKRKPDHRFLVISLTALTARLSPPARCVRNCRLVRGAGSHARHSQQARQQSTQLLDALLIAGQLAASAQSFWMRCRGTLCSVC